jgi:hypothetical protein
MPEKRRRYDPEFRDGALRVVRETGESIRQVAEDHGPDDGYRAVLPQFPLDWRSVAELFSVPANRPAATVVPCHSKPRSILQILFPTLRPCHGCGSQAPSGQLPIFDPNR